MDGPLQDTRWEQNPVSVLAAVAGQQVGPRGEADHYSSTKKWPGAVSWPDLTRRLPREVPALCCKVRCSHQRLTGFFVPALFLCRGGICCRPTESVFTAGQSPSGVYYIPQTSAFCWGLYFSFFAHLSLWDFVSPHGNEK